MGVRFFLTSLIAIFVFLYKSLSVRTQGYEANRFLTTTLDIEEIMWIRALPLILCFTSDDISGTSGCLWLPDGNRSLRRTQSCSTTSDQTHITTRCPPACCHQVSVQRHLEPLINVGGMCCCSSPIFLCDLFHICSCHSHPFSGCRHTHACPQTTRHLKIWTPIFVLVCERDLLIFYHLILIFIFVQKNFTHTFHCFRVWRCGHGAFRLVSSPRVSPDRWD